MLPDTLIYGLVGYTDLTFSEDGYPDTGASGPVVGGGTEFGLGAGWAGRLEYRYLILDADQGEANMHSIRAGVIYKFGGPDPIIPAFDAPAAPHKPLK